LIISSASNIQAKPGSSHLARPLRIEYPGAFHHITSRGVARQDIFFDDEDRHVFLQQLAQAHQRWGIVIHAYCLMTNHYHLDIQTPEGHLSRSLQWINQNYAAYVNRRYQRTGHLFQGRFKNVLIEAEAHLHELTRYIHLNPVRAKMVTSPGLYRWSSYQDYLGLRQPPPWLDLQQTLSHFGHEISQQRQCYQAFVEQEIGPIVNPLQSMVFGAVLGSKDFVEQARSRLHAAQDEREVAQLVKIRPGIPLSTICQVVKREYGLADDDLRTKSHRHNAGRDVAIYLARMHSRRSLREIGEAMGGISPSAVNMAYNRVVRQLSQHPSFRQKLESIVRDWGLSQDTIED
jgi:REP element-mobilizing transposase RayT